MASPRPDSGGEFALIARIARRVAPRADVVLGIGDDGAVLAPRTGWQLVVAADTLNGGVHFPQQTAARDVGHKALAVNLSDLAAMGAQPAWCTLALSLPARDDTWLDGFLDGFITLANTHGMALVGGDTTRGPLAIGVTVLGEVEPGRALRRDGASAGDDVWVSGTLGDAAWALRCVLGEAPVEEVLRSRLDAPLPRLALGRALAGVASACLDVSDGVVQDLGHLCAASGVGAQLWMDALPASPGFAAATQGLCVEERVLLQSSGDDYELCFTAAPLQRAAIESIGEQLGLRLSRIGQLQPGQSVHARLEGEPFTGRPGFDHFR